MPGAVPITATKALTNATVSPCIQSKRLRRTMARDPSLARGVNVVDGEDEAVAGAPPQRYTTPKRTSSRRSESLYRQSRCAGAADFDGENLTTSRVTAAGECDHAQKNKLCRGGRGPYTSRSGLASWCDGAGEFPDAADYGDSPRDASGRGARPSEPRGVRGWGTSPALEGCPPAAPGAPAIRAAARRAVEGQGREARPGTGFDGRAHDDAVSSVPARLSRRRGDRAVHAPDRPWRHRQQGGASDGVIQELGEEHQKTGKWIVSTLCTFRSRRTKKDWSHWKGGCCRGLPDSAPSGQRVRWARHRGAISMASPATTSEHNRHDFSRTAELTSCVTRA